MIEIKTIFISIKLDINLKLDCTTNYYALNVLAKKCTNYFNRCYSLALKCVCAFYSLY